MVRDTHRPQTHLPTSLSRSLRPPPYHTTHQTLPIPPFTSTHLNPPNQFIPPLVGLPTTRFPTHGCYTTSSEFQPPTEWMGSGMYTRSYKRHQDSVLHVHVSGPRPSPVVHVSRTNGKLICQSKSAVPVSQSLSQSSLPSGMQVISRMEAGKISHVLYHAVQPWARPTPVEETKTTKSQRQFDREQYAIFVSYYISPPFYVHLFSILFPSPSLPGGRVQFQSQSSLILRLCSPCLYFRLR
jgi:hypothetical protein